MVLCFASIKGLCMSAAHLGFPTETVVVFVVMAVGAMFIDLFMHRHDKPSR
jgi:tellurite resistance protein TerC